jgi:hypothetical protein
MHSSCNRLPQTSETFSEAADAVAYATTDAQANAFVRGLMWAAGLSTILWIGLAAAFA